MTQHPPVPERAPQDGAIDLQEPLDAYLLERPSLVLTFLDMAERYAGADDDAPGRVVNA